MRVRPKRADLGAASYSQQAPESPGPAGGSLISAAAQAQSLRLAYAALTEPTQGSRRTPNPAAIAVRPVKRKPMDWTFLAIVVVAIAAVFLFKRSSQIGVAPAIAHLRQGARIVDVRTSSEFESDHLDGALNLPLGDLAALAPQQLTDKSQVLLVHCLSGGRSLVAARHLRSMGYSNVFNLGSVGRARSLQRQARTN